MVSHCSQVESSTSGFTPSGGGSSVSMVSIKLFFCFGESLNVRTFGGVVLF